ncbi:hypothetical protein IBG34_23410 (plasmid) [Aeromonas media]|nr:hypothetical protein IBG34_23410 [Aeromonas media]
MKKIALLITSLAITACATSQPVSKQVKSFSVKQGESVPLDMSKEKKDKHGLIPARNGSILSAKIFNTYPVPITISRIEFPATGNATCSIKTNTPIAVAPQSITDVALVDITAIAACHPDLVMHQGAKFIGVPQDHDYSDMLRQTGVMLQVDAKIYKSTSTTTTTYPLIFDLHGID